MNQGSLKNPTRVQPPLYGKQLKSNFNYFVMISWKEYKVAPFYLSPNKPFTTREGGVDLPHPLKSVCNFRAENVQIHWLFFHVLTWPKKWKKGVGGQFRGRLEVTPWNKKSPEKLRVGQICPLPLCRSGVWIAWIKGLGTIRPSVWFLKGLI